MYTQDTATRNFAAPSPKRLKAAMSTIKGIILDYGGTIDTNGIHWGEVIAEQYRAAGIEIGRELYHNAYVHGERSLAKAPIIAPEDTFHTLLRKKIAIQFEYLRQQTHSQEFTAKLADVVADGCYDKVKETLATSRAILEKLSKQYPMVLVTNFYGNMPVFSDNMEIYAIDEKRHFILTDLAADSFTLPNNTVYFIKSKA